MIVTMALPGGRTVHVCPDDEPIFTAREIYLMHRGDYTQEAAEFLANLKAAFPGSRLEDVSPLPEGPPLKGAEQMAFLGFNVDDAPDTQDFGTIPAGDYPAVITASDVLSNKAGTGSYLKLELTITDGKFQGRKLFENLNLDHPNPQAVETARGTLKKIAVACGKTSGVVNESEELHDIPLIVNVGIEKRKDTGEDSNRIRGYKGVTAAPAPRPAAPQPAPSPSTPPRPPAGGKPAWAR